MGSLAWPICSTVVANRITILILTSEWTKYATQRNFDYFKDAADSACEKTALRTSTYLSRARREVCDEDNRSESA